jgi:hypothetical protein
MSFAVRCRVAALAIVILASARAQAPASDQLKPVPLPQVKVSGEATYFHVPDPNTRGFVDDELIQSERRR